MAPGRWWPGPVVCAALGHLVHLSISNMWMVGLVLSSSILQLNWRRWWLEGGLAHRRDLLLFLSPCWSRSSHICPASPPPPVFALRCPAVPLCTHVHTHKLTFSLTHTHTADLGATPSQDFPVSVKTLKAVEIMWPLSQLLKSNSVGKPQRKWPGATTSFLWYWGAEPEPSTPIITRWWSPLYCQFTG